MSVYLKDDGASPEIQDQRAVVEIAYDLRHTSPGAYDAYQRELMTLDKMTGGKGK